MADNDQPLSGGGTGGSGGEQSYLSKGIDALQQSVMGQSKTNPTQEAQSSTEQPPHEAAVDNMHPEQVSEYMRDKYKSTTAEEDREDKAKK